MVELTNLIIKSLSFTILIIHFILISCLLYFIFIKVTKKNIKSLEKIKSLITKNSFYILLLISFVSTFGSLFFSEVAGFEPCTLCWYQRIFLFPQTILLLLAIYTKDKNIYRYLILLSVIGLIISSYHYSISFLNIDSGTCSLNSPSCTVEYFQEFGYITLPMMSITSFILMILFSFKLRIKSKND